MTPGQRSAAALAFVTLGAVAVGTLVDSYASVREGVSVRSAWWITASPTISCRASPGG
jgi:hypothetical protein